MSGLNANIKFERRTPLSVFRGNYTDANKNQWRVDLVGEEVSVLRFVENRPFVVVATPLSSDDARKRKEELILKKPTKGNPQQYETRMPTELDARRVIFTLDKLVGPKPYAVHFEIDPPMNPLHYPETYYFQLQGDDTTANVGYNVNAGTVWVGLAGLGNYQLDGPKVSGAVAIDNVPQSSTWYVGVYWGSGNPDYTLNADLVVF